MEILYENGPCIVVNKPAGLPTQAPRQYDSLEARMKSWVRARTGQAGNVYLAVPHRLDRPVSGCLVLARHVRAARRLSLQFERRTVRKVYWACVAGQVPDEEGTWEDWLRKLPDAARGEVAAAGVAGARPAVLGYQVLGRFAWGTWLEIELGTGRFHQIRVQAAARGWPVLGDELYGSRVPFGPAAADFRQRAIALHARRLAFADPMTRAAVDCTAPLPDFWRPLGLSAPA